MKFKTNETYPLTNEVVWYNANIYEGFKEMLEKNEKFDFLTVDGPPLYNEIFNRAQVVDLVTMGKLEKDFVIMMDDLDRKGEQNTVNLLLQELKKHGYECYYRIYEGSKKHCLITTNQYLFLTSL